ncbi:inositol 1, 3, 4-trisphosphate 56-kinase [Hesseltinella vesiculosa]|uniref:Inositol-tetrakisphosphate 1-kinase n=1 Tax=Hesseltinella vesiculosa TaxID=101127 RepID=A0A1X2GH58_9FUNG|nr:inositol 1, 3, 4-trisphosphate 56-kinase [Hesseltinella vesiculosa]
MTQLERSGTIGLVFTRKKIERSGFIGLEDYAKNHGLTIVHLDMSRSLDDLEQVDLIVHKMTDVVAKMKRKDCQAQEQYDRFMAYCKKYPHTLVLDQWLDIEKLLDRKDMFEHLQACLDMHDATLYKVPKYALLDSLQDWLQVTEHLNFPIICKRRSACSSTEAHQMTVICSRDQGSVLSKYYEPGEPLILQEFIQHDGVIAKVYVAGEQIDVSLRPSLINQSQRNEVIHFDSQTLPKQFDLQAGQDLPHVLLTGATEICREKEAHLDHERLYRMAEALRQQLGLTFFGFDVLLQTETNTYFLVDANYFPSFKNVDNFQPLFVNLIKRKLDL